MGKEFQVPRCSFLLSLAAGILALFSGSGKFFEFDREKILAGHEWWRMITGHLVHWSGEHFFMDALAVLAAGFVVESMLGNNRRAFRSTALWLLGGAFATSGVTLCLLPSMELYRGLSGIAVQLYTLGAILLLVRGVRIVAPLEIFFGIAGLIVLFAKILYELVLGVPIFIESADIGFVVALHAHLVGSAAGVAWAVANAVAVRKANRVEL